MARPRSDEARTAILGAALTLLPKRGYREMTTDAIAAAAGVGKQTIYRWWSTKADVVLDALAEHAREIVAEETGSLAGDVRVFFEATLRLLRGPRGSGPVLRALMAEAQLDAEFAPRFAAFLAARRAALAAVLGRHARDVDAMVDMLFGAMWYRLLVGHGALDDAFAARLGALAATGLSPDA